MWPWSAVPEAEYEMNGPLSVGSITPWHDLPDQQPKKWENSHDVDYP